MKKFLTILLSVLIIASMLFAAPVSAEEAAEVDSNVERVYNYSGDGTPDIWLSNFDDDNMCIGNAYVVFNAAAPFTGIYMPHFWAGVLSNDQDCDVRLEVFNYDTDDETTMKGTAVFKKEHHMDGDIHGYELPFDATLPAGQYMFKVTQLGDRGPNDASCGRYCVLPRATKLLYSDSFIGSGERGQFAFAVDFVKTEGVEKYFKALQNQDQEYELDPLETVSEYIGGAAESINAAGEFVVVTPVIPDNKVLFSFTITKCPTWNNQEGTSDLYFEVYKWLGDYVSSVDNGLIYEGEILDHKDNSDLTIKLGTNCRYGNRYMLILTAPDGLVGYYLGSDDVPEGWEFYAGDAPADMTPACSVTYATVGDLGPEPTRKPTAEPTVAPATQAPGENDTEVTLPPSPTEKADKNVDAKKGGSALPIIIIAVCAVIIIAAVVVVILKKRKK